MSEENNVEENETSQEQRNHAVDLIGAHVPESWKKTIDKGRGLTLTYVGVGHTIKRFNEAVGDNWDVVIKNIIFGTTSVYDKYEKKLVDKTCVTVHVSVSIYNEDKTIVRDGIGGDVSNAGKTIDDIVKTAYANAFKKATNMFGFANELWTDDIDDNTTNSGYNAPSSNVSSAPIVSLSDDSRNKIDQLCKDINVTKEELRDILKEVMPESNGNPIYLAGDNETIKVDDFITKVKEKYAS